MSENAPKPLSELIFRAGSAVNDLARRAESAIELAAALRGALPDELAGALQAATLREDGTVVVMAVSPAWAARLRFEADTLLARCRERHPGATRLRVRVSGAPAPDHGD